MYICTNTRGNMTRINVGIFIFFLFLELVGVFDYMKYGNMDRLKNDDD